MDWSISPDIDAFWCYGIVLLLAGISARGEVRTRLDKILRLGAAFTWEALALFLAFWMTPVVLFWLLDRLGALNDTSLFGAVAVGIGYKQILDGGYGKLSVTGEVSGFWKRFLSWAENVSTKAFEKFDKDDVAFAETVISEAVKSEQKLETLKDIASQRSVDLTALVSNLEKVTVQARDGALGAETAKQQKARILYDNLSGYPGFALLLVKQKIISRIQYYWYLKHWRNKLPVFSLYFVLLVSIVLVVLRSRSFSTSNPRISYCVWRINKKPNTSKVDLCRTQERLAAYLKDPATFDRTQSLLERELRTPAISTESAAMILKVIVRGRLSDEKSMRGLADLLIGMLRADSADARAYAQNELMLLAREKIDKQKVPDELADWKPVEAASPLEIEIRITQWQELWVKASNP